jgi:hypothetical protein
MSWFGTKTSAKVRLPLVNPRCPDSRNSRRRFHRPNSTTAASERAGVGVIQSYSSSLRVAPSRDAEEEDRPICQALRRRSSSEGGGRGTDPLHLKIGRSALACYASTTLAPLLSSQLGSRQAFLASSSGHGHSVVPDSSLPSSLPSRTNRMEGKSYNGSKECNLVPSFLSSYCWLLHRLLKMLISSHCLQRLRPTNIQRSHPSHRRILRRGKVCRKLRQRRRRRRRPPTYMLRLLQLPRARRFRLLRLHRLRNHRQRATNQKSSSLPSSNRSMKSM